MILPMKKNKLKINAILSGVLTLCFVLFTILVKCVDTAYVGATDKKIGFSSLNAIFYNNIQVSDLFDKLSDVLMIISIAIIALAVVVSVVQLVKRKSLKKIDREFYAFAIVLVLMVCVYVMFEIIDLNFRPVLIDGKVEASYPSSHTMLELTVFMCLMVYGLSNLKSNKQKIICSLVLGALIIAVVLFRVLSGMHWATDIIASIILSLMLTSYYILINAIFLKFEDKNEKQGQ